MHDFPALLNQARAEWEKLLFPLPRGRAVLASILEAYSEEHRHYHTLEHIAEMTALLGESHAKITSRADVLLACLYHDIVYNARRSDNEELSAARFEADAATLGITAPQRANVTALIMATKKHQLGNDSRDMKLFLDSDLAILGAAPERYQRYAADVRKEYAHVPDADYRAGRGAVLKKFLERDRLYFTDELRERLESKARENMKREIAGLVASPSSNPG